MIVGVHNFVDAVSHYTHEVTNSDGGLWIVLMDGLFLIPLAMAAFFYPMAALAALAALVVLSGAGVVGTRMYQRRHPHD